MGEEMRELRALILEVWSLENLEGRRWSRHEQEAQLMLTTGSTRLAVSRGQQTWYHSICYI